MSTESFLSLENPIQEASKLKLIVTVEEISPTQSNKLVEGIDEKNQKSTLKKRAFMIK